MSEEREQQATMESIWADHTRSIQEPSSGETQEELSDDEAAGDLAHTPYLETLTEIERKYKQKFDELDEEIYNLQQSLKHLTNGDLPPSPDAENAALQADLNEKSDKLKLLNKEISQNINSTCEFLSKIEKTAIDLLRCNENIYVGHTDDDLKSMISKSTDFGRPNPNYDLKSTTIENISFIKISNRSLPNSIGKILNHTTPKIMAEESHTPTYNERSKRAFARTESDAAKLCESLKKINHYFKLISMQLEKFKNNYNNISSRFSGKSTVGKSIVKYFEFRKIARYEAQITNINDFLKNQIEGIEEFIKQFCSENTKNEYIHQTGIISKEIEKRTIFSSYLTAFFWATFHLLLYYFFLL